MLKRTPVSQWLTGGMAAAAMLIAGAAQAQTVEQCTSDCAQLTVSSGGSGSPTSVSFQQGAADGEAGGIDEVAALAFTLEFPGDGSGPLALADCGAEGSGSLPPSVVPSSALDGFSLIVENYRCDEGRTHCVCPSSGSATVPDDFLNVAIFGPNPLPAPGSGPVVIPPLPSGELFTVAFAAADGTAEGTTVALHVLNQVDDADKGAFRAFLSLGDTEAVDQTCVPEDGTPPCGGGLPVSQVVVVDGVLTVEDNACVGDCDGGGDVTVDEIITMVNIALGSGAATVNDCRAGDANGDNLITVDEIVTAVNNALNGCP